jgi:hypothetical protein
MFVLDEVKLSIIWTNGSNCNFNEASLRMDSIIFMVFDKGISDKVIFGEVLFDKGIFDEVIFDKVIFDEVIKPPF